MAPSEARRVSYVIPSPLSPPPYLSLPSPTHARNGSPHPILLKSSHQPPSAPTTPQPTPTPINNPFFNSTNPSSSSSSIRPAPPPASHPQHSLGIPALALDCSTQLAGNSGPQGILYTGGRDGLVAGWELGVNMKRRGKGRRYGYEDGGRRGWVRWNELGGGDDDDDEEDYDQEEEDERDREEEEYERGAGAGAAEETKRIPYEERWEVDLEQEGRTNGFEAAKPPAATFRQCVQYHTDWVNDLVLCNLNQTLISASSDRTIRAWNPHSTEGSMSPTVIGHHTDYVRCLAYSREQQFVASGGFDRQIKLWDINHPTTTSTPLLTLNHAEVTKEKSSIYSLATCPSGNVVAAGSPERVIRVWDPRAGGRRICKLVGHTDNIRALLVSEDGKFMLSGSSDATIKLWSLSAQRVLHTFNHHSDSVWSLFSNHPNFERFYSGDRSGNIAVVDMERCSDVSEGECVLLGREGGDPDEAEIGGNPLATRGSVGINKIVAMDDAYVWTSTSSSSVNVWKDVGRRTRRIPGFRPTPHFDDEFRDEDDDELYSRSPLLGPSSDLSPSPTPEPSTTATTSSFPKRLSLDLQPSSLAPTRSRDSHSVAFAPHSPPSNPNFTIPLPETYIPSILKRGRKDRVDSLQGSVVSSVEPTDQQPPPPSSPPPKPALDGVPYDSLINLGSPDSPYGFSGRRPGPDADIATIYSAASVLSVPHLHRTADHSRNAVAPPPPGSGLTTSNGSSLRPTPTIGGSSALPGQEPALASSAMSTRFAEEELVKEAKRDFEERDLVADAFPLWTAPVGTIEGKHGLVRSLMLNDRQHVVTCDTAGVIAVWNILTCHCVGLISSTSVLEAHSSGSSSSSLNGSSTPALTPREALELVKERIEGEAVTPTWCSVDTRIGGLTVHLEEGRCFDAEIHLDELEDVVGGPFKEDQKVSVGKLILANLFSGFVKAELRRQRSSSSTPSASVPVSPTSSTGITRHPAPTFIPLHDSLDSSTKFKPPTSSSDIPSTPGGIMVLATPAMTPALAPEADDFFSLDRSSGGMVSPRQNNGHPHSLHPIPGSPMQPTPGTEGTLSKPTSPSEQPSGGGRDYFSLRGDRSRTTSGRRAATLTGAEPLTTTTAVEETPFSPGGGDPPATPGGTFMGKFKGFGKGKKAPVGGVATPAPVVEVSEEESQRLADEAQFGALPPRDLYQRRVLSHLLTPPLKPPSANDAPPLPTFSDPAIFVDEESRDAGAWAVIYRGATSSTGEDVEALEMALPVWVLEFLLSGRAALKDPVKMSFVLEPWKGEGWETMEEMPSGNSRLTAARSLRVRKICSYISDRLHLVPPRSRAVSLSPTPVGTPHPSSANLQGLASAASSAGFAFSRIPPPPRTSADGDFIDPTRKPEEIIELVCNGMVLPVKMTLGAVRAFVFRGGGDIVIGYRLRKMEEYED
ncbi:hypothetical protein BDY24DRAFT_417926 [Mrakia frigida]|uniref:uncharacterized protein n=1 Tax=Mrakia frigida TaxID=29902 RepID=UPI003FCBF629